MEMYYPVLDVTHLPWQYAKWLSLIFLICLPFLVYTMRLVYHPQYCFAPYTKVHADCLPCVYETNELYHGHEMLEPKVRCCEHPNAHELNNMTGQSHR